MLTSIFSYEYFYDHPYNLFTYVYSTPDLSHKPYLTQPSGLSVDDTLHCWRMSSLTGFCLLHQITHSLDTADEHPALSMHILPFPTCCQIYPLN